MRKDLHNNIKVVPMIYPVDHGTGNTATVSQIVDMQDAQATEIVGLLGSLADADATFAVLIEDGNDSALADNAEVAAANLLGTEAGASFIFSSDNMVFKVGYVGPKRYLRVTITPANNTGAALIGVCAILTTNRGNPDTTQLGTTA